jgi:hypothetical protein
MALPVSVPYTFANATTTQNLSYLDADFAAVYNAVNGIGNGTVSLSNVSITGGTISANLSASGIFSGTSNVVITSSSGPVSISTNGNSALYIDASQNVGIGTTSPADYATKFLHINGTTDASLHLTTTASGATLNDGSDIQVSGTDLQLINREAGAIQFYTSLAERMRIDSSGNLMVGSTSASGKLTVTQSAVAIGGFFRSNTSTPGYHGVYSEAQQSYGLYGRTYNASYGGVIGFNNDNTVYGILGAGGYGLLTNASINVNGTTYTSDGRLKENVKTIENGLDVLSKLNPVSFDWKEKSSRGPSSDFGLIAQEVEQVIPECVFEATTPARTPEMTHKVSLEEELGTYKGVDYSRFIPFLIAAVKELSAKNDALEARLVALESK